MTLPDSDEECKIILSIFKKSSFDDAEPHMVQNGVPCGDGRFCVQGKCSAVRDYFPECPNNCTMHGTCNNHNQCACDCGWKGPECSEISYCHEKFLLAMTLLAVSAISLILIVVVIYIVRSTYFG